MKGEPDLTTVVVINLSKAFLAGTKIQCPTKLEMGQLATGTAHNMVHILLQRVLEVVLMTGNINHILVFIHRSNQLIFHVLVGRMGNVLAVAKEFPVIGVKTSYHR